MNRALLFALAALPLFVACKKDDPKTKTELLTDKNWQLKAATSDPGFPVNGTTVTDYYGQLGQCSKDDIERFEKPNVYKFDEGANRCSGQSQTTVGTWVFSSDESKITITDASGSQTAEILELSDNTMKLKFQIPGANVIYNITATYSKI
jgi:Lipocalin-like domain